MLIHLFFCSESERYMTNSEEEAVCMETLFVVFCCLWHKADVTLLKSFQNFCSRIWTFDHQQVQVAECVNRQLSVFSPETDPTGVQGLLAPLYIWRRRLVDSGCLKSPPWAAVVSGLQKQ